MSSKDPSSRPPRARLARNITLLGGAFLLAILTAICGVMTVLLVQRAEERTVSWVDAKVQGLAQALDAYDQTARLLVERFFKVYADQFGKAFTLDEAGGRLTQLGIALNDYHNHADKFTEFTGGAAAVLMRKGDAFVAINTSLKDAKGERALALAVDAKHPAHASLLKGQPYVGRTVLQGRPYVTRLQPVRDLQERIVGALFVAFDLSDFDRSLERMVAEAKFFATGGAYLVDPAGSGTLVAPAALRGRALKAEGGVRSVLAAVEAGSAGHAVRDFRPVLQAAESGRFAVARRSESTGWWVVAEVSSAEAAREQWLTLVPFLALFGGAAVALCIGQYVLIRRWVGAPLHTLTAALDTVAAGDLSQPVQSTRNDEIGAMMHGVERMRQRFVAMLGEVRASADTIALASSEIATGNRDLSRRTEEAAARLQQATAEMEQITRSVREAAEAARTADDLASGASQAAERGGEAVGLVAQRMGSIAAGSRRIAEITSVIDGIAFQTNILALNAAVEAARAGDSGRGFAVVAGEVRGLARRAADAAKEIKALIGASVAEVESGSSLADTASTRMHEIVSSVTRVSTALTTISAGAGEQSDSIGRVNGSVATLDRMTQQNAALVEQSSAAAESMRAQVAQLAAAVAQFRLAATQE